MRMDPWFEPQIDAVMNVLGIRFVFPDEAIAEPTDAPDEFEREFTVAGDALRAALAPLLVSAAAP